MQLVKVSYEQCRLDFFKKQLKTAERSMNYAVKHNYHPSICSEKGDIVSFYEWAVKMAEKEIDKAPTVDAVEMKHGIVNVEKD